jgi:hypothetical protein
VPHTSRIPVTEFRTSSVQTFALGAIAFFLVVEKVYYL